VPILLVQAPTESASTFLYAATSQKPLRDASDPPRRQIADGGAGHAAAPLIRARSAVSIRTPLRIAGQRDRTGPPSTPAPIGNCSFRRDGSGGVPAVPPPTSPQRDQGATKIRRFEFDADWRQHGRSAQVSPTDAEFRPDNVGLMVVLHRSTT